LKGDRGAQGKVVSREQPGMRLFVTVREMEERPSGVGF